MAEGLAVIRYSTAWTASLRKLSGSLDLNAAMPLATLCAPKCSLRCVSSASAFGVSCALEAVLHGAMDRHRGLELLHPQNCEMCHPAILPLSAISGLTTLSHGKS